MFTLFTTSILHVIFLVLYLFPIFCLITYIFRRQHYYSFCIYFMLFVVRSNCYINCVLSCRSLTFYRYLISLFLFMLSDVFLAFKLPSVMLERIVSLTILFVSFLMSNVEMCMFIIIYDYYSHIISVVYLDVLFVFVV